MTINSKKKQVKDEVWLESDGLGVTPPEIKLFAEVALQTVLKSVPFDLVDRGGSVEKTVYMKNMSTRTIYDLQLEAHAEPDSDWPSKKSAVGPMHLQVEPSELKEWPAGYVVPVRLTWVVAEDEPLGTRVASITGTARFTSE